MREGEKESASVIKMERHVIPKKKKTSRLKLLQNNCVKFND